MEPRPPTQTNTPLAQPVSSEGGDTASGSHTAAGGAPPRTPPAPPREPQPGDAVGPYHLVEELGRGGMAAVFLAADAALARKVALKVLLPSTVAKDPEAKARFVREARAQAAVQHEHVVAIYSVGEDAGLSFLAMPVLKGQTLSRALQAHARLSVGEVLRIGSEIAEGLAAAHGAGLVHRDIKPGNIWLEAPKRWVKLLDFGLARDPEATDAQITISGRVVGTPAYMSPEQAAGKPVDFRTDIFSLGVVLYQMATGQKPFTGDTSLNIMAAILTADPLPPVALVPDLPPALSSLVMRMLAKDPARRPKSAAAVAAELQSIKAALDAPVVVALPPEPAADPWSELDFSAAEEPAPASKPGPRAPKRRERPEEPRRRGRRDEARPFPWLWVAAGVAGVVGALGLVVFAWFAFSNGPKPRATEVADQKKDREPPKGDGKTKGKPPEPAVDHDRLAAEKLRPAAKLKLDLESGGTITISPREELPAGKFTILEIDLGDDPIEPGFADATLLPALAQLKSVTKILLNRWQITLTPEQLKRLSALPVAATLQRLDAKIELAPETVTHLAKFTSLRDFSCRVAGASDELFKELAKFARNNGATDLALFSLVPNSKLTAEGWQALADLKLRVITISRFKGIAEAFPILAAKDAARGIDLMGCPLSDEALRGLAKGTDLEYLRLIDAAEVTDEGLLSLADVPSLGLVTLANDNKVKLTEKGAQALADARPDLKVLWNGKLLAPKKKP